MFKCEYCDTTYEHHRRNCINCGAPLTAQVTYSEFNDDDIEVTDLFDGVYRRYVSHNTNADIEYMARLYSMNQRAYK
jgi:hypothetical protein